MVLNTSPNPGICLSAISFIASGVISLPVNPVPPVVIITSISNPGMVNQILRNKLDA